MYKLSRLLAAATAISAFLFVFGPGGIERRFFGRLLAEPVLQPGDRIDDMVITTGVEHAYPLSAVCSATKENDHSIRVDCGELSVCANLAIGHTFGVTDVARPGVNWDDFTWKLSVDGRPIDLEAFGVFDSARPDLAPSPSPVREVFRRVRLWDVVLVNPTPGMHRLQGEAQPRDGGVPYTWVVNFTVGTP